MSEKKIVVSQRQLDRLPGKSSNLSAVRLRGMVEALLVEAGIGTRAWLTKEGRDVLAFEVVQTEGETRTVLHFKFEVPRIYLQQRRGVKYLESASWRFFHDYMEHRLYAVILGFDSVVEQFTDHLVMVLPDGREATVRDRIAEAVKAGSQEALPYIRRPVDE